MVSGQTTTENYVKVTDYRIETQTGSGVSDDDKIESISYYDGLGRPVQSIVARAGGNGEDNVSHIEYNEFGQSPRQYLPWANTGSSSLGYINPTTLVTNISNFYDTPKYEDTDNPFSEAVYEEAPRLRTDEQAAPGNSWDLGSGNTVRFDYSVNVNGDDVYKFAVDFTGGDTGSPELILDTPPGGSEGSEYFSPGLLVKNITKDENWSSAGGGTLKNHTVEEYLNKRGQMVLKRTFESGLNHDTYYVYDSFGNLTFVIPPKAADLMVSSGALASNYLQVLDDLCYQYKYDLRNRQVWKKLPGKVHEFIIYDNLDRPVLTQDKNQRDSDQWLFTKYDPFGRVAYTGIYTTTDSRATIIGDIEGQSVFNESSASGSSIGGTTVHYTNFRYPTTGLETLTVNYYDDYVDTAGLFVPVSVFGVTPISDQKGLPTVTKVKVMDGLDSAWITTITGYDDRNQVIYTASLNDYYDITDEVQMQLDFSGNVIESETIHSRNGNDDITIRDYYTYDQANRLLTHEQKIDDEPVQLIAGNFYDDLGMLEQKDVGGETFVDGYTDLTKADVINQTTIKKNGLNNSWDAGGKTRGEVLEDGGVSWKVNVTGEYRVGVLKSSNTASGWDDFDYAIEHTVIPNIGGGGQEINVIIDGGIPFNLPAFPAYEVGDELKIERDWATKDIKFYHEGVEFYSHADNSLSNQDALTGKVGLKGSTTEVGAFLLVGPGVDLVLQNIDYQYNVRGWLTDINDITEVIFGLGSDDLFKFRINYDVVEGAATSDPLFNGNISQTFWRTNNSDTNLRSYGYDYDAMNRLSQALSYEGTNVGFMSVSHDHDVTGVGYDKNGNINSLTRRGFDDNNTFVDVWDNLTYIYDGNKLTEVIDYAAGLLPTYGFNDANTGANEFGYDDNGNMTRDDNKGITNVDYNHLNLPTAVHFGSDRIEYVYDATGVKMKKTKIESGVSDVNTEYAGSFIYSDNGASAIELQFFVQPEGYVHPVLGTSGSTKGHKGGTTTYSAYEYVFQYKDHLGNVRLSYKDDDLNGAVNASEIIEENNYYPFGLKQKGYNTNFNPIGSDLAQQWKFGGKQINEELDLGWYDFGARNYDASLGRWMNIDPLAEEMRRHSPYSYAFSNPVFFVDPDGMQPIALTKYQKTGNGNALGTALIGSGTFSFMNVDKNSGKSNVAAPNRPQKPGQPKFGGSSDGRMTHSSETANPPTDFIDEDGNLVASTDDGSDKIFMIKNRNLNKFIANLRNNVDIGKDIDQLENETLGLRYGEEFRFTSWYNCDWCQDTIYDPEEAIDTTRTKKWWEYYDDGGGSFSSEDNARTIGATLGHPLHKNNRALWNLTPESVQESTIGRSFIKFSSGTRIFVDD